jgi:hypothetical protein
MEEEIAELEMASDISDAGEEGGDTEREEEEVWTESLRLPLFLYTFYYI